MFENCKKNAGAKSRLRQTGMEVVVLNTYAKVDGFHVPSIRLSRWVIHVVLRAPCFIHYGTDFRPQSR